MRPKRDSERWREAAATLRQHAVEWDHIAEEHERKEASVPSVDWLHDRLGEAFALLRVHQEVHGTAADHPIDDPKSYAWREQRDQFIEHMRGIFR